MADLFKTYFDKVKVVVGKLYADTILDMLLSLVEQKTGVESAVIAMGTLAFLGLYLIFGWCNDFVCNIVGLIYPIYASVMSMAFSDTSNQKKLLTYWIIYSSLGCVEYVLHGVCNFLRIYWLAKFIFLMWFIKSGPAPSETDSGAETNPGFEQEILIDFDKKEEPPVPQLPRKKAVPSGIKRRQLRLPPRSIDLSPNAKWEQYGTIVAGGHGNGDDLNQVYSSRSVFVDDDLTIYVADSCNNRLVEWKPGATEGRVLISGYRENPHEEKLPGTNDFIIDKSTNSFITANCFSNKIERWSRNGDTDSEVILSGFECTGVTMDENGSFYMVDNGKHEVIRYEIGSSEATIVAGGNGEGDGLNQFKEPSSIFVDQDYSVYVSDGENHRVMKWVDGATEGIVVAGGNGQGDSLSQLSYPKGIVVDPAGTLYIADFANARVVRWLKDAKQGEIVVGGNSEGEELNQVTWPSSLMFDKYGDLYVNCQGSARVVKFRKV